LTKQGKRRFQDQWMQRGHHWLAGPWGSGEDTISGVIEVRVRIWGPERWDAVLEAEEKWVHWIKPGGWSLEDGRRDPGDLGKLLCSGYFNYV
jgi:hypothetical protein